MLLISCGVLPSSINIVNIFDITNQKLINIEVPEETHDVVQGPVSNNLIAAFGRRPPSNKSYIIDTNLKVIKCTFNSLPNHAFYGHGFWINDEIIGTAEVSIIDYSSHVVLRDATAPDIVLRTYRTSGKIIHSIEYCKDDNNIYIAHNGDWHNSAEENEKNQASLQVINLSTEESKIYFFKLPFEFGLQHFVKKNNIIYCLFRISPTSIHDKTCTNSPLIELNLLDGSIQEFTFPHKILLDHFQSDGLSICLNNEVLATTSQRGGMVCFWDLKTKRLIHSLLLEFPSGITEFNNDYYISTAKGKIVKYNLKQNKMEYLSHEFYTSSHHQCLS